MNAFPRTILIVAAAIGLALVVFLRFDRARSQVDLTTALTAERDALKRQLAAANRQLSELKSREANDADSPADGAFEPARHVSFRGQKGGVRFGATESFETLSGPAFRPEWMDAHLKAHLKNRYEPLLQRPGFPREVAEKFMNLLLEKQTAAADVFDAAHAQGVEFDESTRASLRSMAQDARAQVDERLRELLGSDAYQQYKYYEETLPFRGTVEQLAGKLAWTGEPLSGQQSEQLLGLLAANAPTPVMEPGAAGHAVMAFAVEGAGVAGGVVTTSDQQAIADAVLEQAGGVLTPRQLEGLRQIQAEQTAAQRVFATLPNDGPRLHLGTASGKK